MTGMELGLIRGLGTAILLASFIVLVIWAYTPGRRQRFNEAAQLPFLGDDEPGKEGAKR